MLKMEHMVARGSKLLASHLFWSLHFWDFPLSSEVLVSQMLSKGALGAGRGGSCSTSTYGTASGFLDILNLARAVP